MVAADLNSGIGKNGQLPWKLPGDLKYFKELTCNVRSSELRNAVIMGRKTWESIPDKFRPLSNRINVILTRAFDYELPKDVLKASSLDDALEKLQSFPVDKCFVIGGGEVYREALLHPACDRVYLTEVKSIFDCDTVFPEFGDRFTEISSSNAIEDGGISYCFKVFHKRKGFN